VALTGASEYVSPSTLSLRMPSSYEKYVELYCYKSAVWFLIPLAYNISLMLVCTVISFGTRKRSENFHESWFTFASVATTMFAWVVFIPAYFTSYYAYMQSAILGFRLVVIVFVTLLCQYLPILYAVLFVPTEKMKLTTITESRVSKESVDLPSCDPI
jgi:7 transmembrane sweet-taste receptor of 3 GCPR